MDDGCGQVVRTGGQGFEQAVVGDGDAVALVGADQVVGRVGWVGRVGCGLEVEALFIVCGDEGLQFGEGYFYGADCAGGELGVRLVEGRFWNGA